MNECDECDDCDRILNLQRKLLTGVADALNGNPPHLVSWSHHDLPEKAEALRVERDDLKMALRRILDVESEYTEVLLNLNIAGRLAKIDAFDNAIGTARNLLGIQQS